MADLTVNLTEFNASDINAPIGQPFTFGDKYGAKVGRMKVFRQDCVMLVPTHHDCTADKYSCTYLDATTALMKVPNGSAFEQGGVWIEAFFKDEENRIEAMQAATTRASAKDTKPFHITFSENLNTNMKPSVKVYPFINIRKDPQDLNSKIEAIVNALVFTFQFEREIPLGMEQSISEQLGGLNLGM
jgi:hypothetical protein